MILFDLRDGEGVAAAYPILRPALAWLAAHRGDAFVEQRVDIDERAYAKYERPAMRPRERARLEAHRRYIDIHVPLSADEAIGWAPTKASSRVVREYDADTDIMFYGDDAHSIIHVRPGEAVVFFPEDTHAPNIGIGYHKKITIKIAVG